MNMTNLIIGVSVTALLTGVQMADGIPFSQAFIAPAIGSFVGIVVFNKFFQ